MFHVHKWTDWIVTEQGRLVDYWRPHLTVGTYLNQSRHCLACGKTQIKCQRTSSDGNAFLVPEEKKTASKHDKVSL